MTLEVAEWVLLPIGLLLYSAALWLWRKIDAAGRAAKQRMRLVEMETRVVGRPQPLDLTVIEETIEHDEEPYVSQRSMEEVRRLLYGDEGTVEVGGQPVGVIRGPVDVFMVGAGGGGGSGASPAADSAPAEPQPRARVPITKGPRTVRIRRDSE